MSRGLSAGMAAEVVKPVVTPVLLYEATLADNSVVRYWTGVGTLSWNGNAYDGSGTLIGITPVEETDDVKAGSATVTINGAPAADLSLALQSLANGKAGIVRLALLDAAGGVIATPRVLFRGRLDGAEVNEADITNPILGIEYMNELSDLERPRELRYTHEDQQRFYPGDLGLQYIANLQDKEVNFGRK